MRFTRTFKLVCSIMMSAMMTNIPSVSLANQGGQGMIPTNVVVEQLDRAQAEQDIKAELSREDIKKALVENGVSVDEVSARLASLSDSELRQLNTQLVEARAGGDILIAILVVVLIIFLIKRI